MHAIRMTHIAGASHIGGCLSSADILGVLYADILRVDPANPGWEDRDRFVLSKGHAAAILYATLAEKGFFPPAELAGYSAQGSRLLGHASHDVPGVELSTGSLGHGLPVATGMALAAHRQGRPWRVYALLSDGELDEGSNWEAILFAPQHRLDNLVVVVDYNKIQSFGSVAEVMELHPLAAKFAAFRWGVREVDGHNHEELRSALRDAPFVPGAPSAIVAHTIKGNGITFMANQLAWHYKSPNSEQVGQAIREIQDRA